MKLIIKREKVLQPLAYVNSVVERRQTLPILANAYLKLDNNQMLITGTDLEVEITTFIDDISIAEEGECTLTAQKFLDICRALPDDADIKLTSEKNKVLIQSGRSRFTLQSLPSDDFPRIETQNWLERFTIKQSELKQLIDNTSFSMAQQDVRYYLNGLLFEISKNKLVSVATDGHRLSKSETTIKGSDNDEARQAIVPRKAITELNRLLNVNDENVTVELNDHHIRFTFADIIFTSKLIDGKFPDYRSVMSSKLPVKLDIDRQAFYQTLLRASILTNDKFRGIRLGFKDSILKVSSTNPEQEEANDEMNLDDYQGPELEIGFNVNYLMDILKVLNSEKVELSVKDENSSCTLNMPEDNKSKYLVMPMRL